jgi:hypothetical protein
MDETRRKLVLGHCREIFCRQRRRDRGHWPRYLIAFGSLLGILCCANILLVRFATLGSSLESSLVLASLELYAVALGAWLMAVALWAASEVRDQLAWRRLLRGRAHVLPTRVF